MMHTKKISTYRAIRNKRILILTFLFLIVQSAVSVANIIDIEGDKDGFGVGTPIANGLNFTDYGAILTDYREPSDPVFTDTWINGDQSWTHTYDLMGATPLSASLEIYVAGIVDNPAWNADVLINNVVIGTIPPETSSYDITRILTFNVPVQLLNSPDGITINLNNGLDGYIIDYSQLSIDTGTPGTPTNDSAANAIPIGNVTNLAFDTTGATSDGPSDGSMQLVRDIWYCYTATCTGTATVSLCGSTFDTQLAVYSGCQAPATLQRELAYDDDFCNLQSQVSLSVVCGNQYLIQVGGFGQNTVGTGVLSVSCSGTPCSTGPANDNCANAQAIGNVTNLAFSTANATHDGPGVCMTSPNIWYKYTATCTGTAEISLCGSSFDTVLAAYSGTNCSNLALIGCNDDSCAQQSQLSINVIAGKSYWIEVGGYGNSVGTGVLTVSCGGQVQQASDLGDAPDNTNHFPSSNMRTYDHLAPAKFPTVYDGDANVGPIHFEPKSVAYLGNSVTFEDEADQGYDQDPTNNIIPSQLNVNANRDLGDDGVVLTLGKLALDHCKLNAFSYNVNVIDPSVDMYVNVWFDWNRDGDWEDSGLNDLNLNCESCNTDGIVNEWAVQNQLLYALNPGLNTITTPGFLAWNPATGDQKIWMRITLSEEPWKGGSGSAGSGPLAGYQYGETEDYYFAPNTSCVVCDDLNRDGIVDEFDLFTYMLNWLDNCID